VLIARQIGGHWWSAETPSTHLRTAIDAGSLRIGVKGDAEDQLCVPAVLTKGDSHRLAQALAGNGVVPLA
jgi:hypothetical protein